MIVYHLFKHNDRKLSEVTESCENCRDKMNTKLDTLHLEKSRLEREITNHFNELKISLTEKYATKQDVDAHIIGLRNDIQTMCGDVDKQFGSLEVAIKELSSHLYFSMGKDSKKDENKQSGFHTW